jgi:HAE1 family hydrophobic/amphiphilic exporter-1
MNIVEFFIRRPVTAMVMALLIVLFGVVGILKLPIQMTPDITLPKLRVMTTWPGASPYEVERDIIERQEDVLKSLKGLYELESTSQNNVGVVDLTFDIEVDINDALLRTSNKLNEVPYYPDNVEKPVIDASGSNSQPVIWIMFKTLEGNPEHIDTYRTYFDNSVRQYLERIPGVGSLEAHGGTERRLEAIVNMDNLAKFGLTITEVAEKIRSANVNVSAGVLDVGRKAYRLRTVSKYENAEDPMEIVLVNDGLRKVRLRDIATAVVGYESKRFSIMERGTDVIAIGITKEQGANTIELVSRAKEVVKRLNKDVLNEKKLELKWVHDETSYIFKAIDIVQSNILIGALLAVCILFLFLRSFSSTFTVSLAIPISSVGAFLFLWLMDRNLNIVSLAGISFAVGMLVDSAIVVLENIDRHRKMGKNAFEASFQGANEVWGAIFASAMTTIAVFLPVIFIQEEAGQLFKDIAITITAAISLSLIVSITLIPSLMNLFYSRFEEHKEDAKKSAVVQLGGKIVGIIMALSRFTMKTVFHRLATIFVLFGAAYMTVVILIPDAEYLPQGQQNFVLGLFMPSPGSSQQRMEEIGKKVFKAAEPHYEKDGVNGVPQIEQMFYVGSEMFNVVGLKAKDETAGGRLVPFAMQLTNMFPGIMGFAFQVGLFESEIGGGRSIRLNVSGPELEEIITGVQSLFGVIAQKIPGAQIRPVPSFEITYPEAVFVPDRNLLAANGFTEEELALYIDMIMDGRKIAEFQPEGQKSVDLVVRVAESEIQVPEDVLKQSIANRYGNFVKIGDLVQLKYASGMDKIMHYERERTIRLEITPPDSIPLQTAMNIVENEVLEPMKKSGALDGLTTNLGGSADKLTKMLETFKWNFLLAIVITYLLLSALLESFLYSLIIMCSIPFAAAGGFLGLWLINFRGPQAFDVLTMLGFIILVGTVVNNAILIVYQSLQNVREENMDGMEAIFSSVQSRIRPIFMSTLTSLLGLTPLALASGAGSELYRGIGSVILGGLGTSTVLSLFLIPAVLSFFIGLEVKKRRKKADD